MKKHFFTILLLSACIGLNGQTLSLTDHRWLPVEAKGDVAGRHENGFIEYNNKFYLIGGNLPTIDKVSSNNGYTRLFNGTNLDGWQVKAQKQDQGKTFWTVEDGAILCNSLGSKEHGYIWLINNKEFGDFELRLKFRVSTENKGNAGVQIRSRYFENDVVEGEIPGWLDGPQVDIEPGNPWRTGLIYDETRTEKRWISPSLTDWKITKENTTHNRVIFYPENELSGWNDMMIVCKGTNIKTFVNNFLVSDLDGAGLLDNEGHKKYNVGLKGHIALQLHKNSENKIWFKDIEVRELK